jgi:hypothetical protein
MYWLIVLVGFAVALACNQSLAQSESGHAGPVDVIKQLGDFGEKKLAVLLIFGTGFVAALCWGVSAVVAAFRHDAGSAAGLRDALGALEERVASLERISGSRAPAADEPVRVR